MISAYTRLLGARGFEGRVDGRLEQFVGGAFDADAVDEDGRRAAHPGALAVLQVAAHAVGEAARVERRVELRAVEPDARGVLLQSLDLKRRLVLVEEHCVLPVLTLLARG